MLRIENMNKEETKKRIGNLRKVIDHHRYLYHVLDRQEISDAALDSLKKELFDLELEYPELITPDSPTQRIGGKPLKEFKKVKHIDSGGNEARMNSLNDVFSPSELMEWGERLRRNLDKSNLGDFYSDLKMDGLAIELVYEDGLLIQASTRGDGLFGEDVTQNIKTIEAIPLHLELGKTDFPNKLIVRGEVFLTKKEFARINAEQKKHGEKIYANPRNVAAGSIRQLNPKITASRKLSFYAYSIVGQTEENFPAKGGSASGGRKYPTHDNEYRILNELGIPTNPEGKVCGSLDEVIKFYESIEQKRDKLPHEIDGIVVSLNNNEKYQRAGIVGKAPRGAVAFKFAPNEAETVVEDIIVQVGRTGTLTPVAVLRPVRIGGVTVSRATLHNLDEIKRLGVRKGDTVIVDRAGDVIPNVKQVIKEMRIGKEKEFHMPKKCRVCDSLIEQLSGQVAFKCTNKNCPAIKREAIYHFVSRKAFDIDGVGPKIIDQLMESGLIFDVADLFRLKKEDLLNLERFAEKSAENTINAIQSKKRVGLNKFIYSLGIEHVGEETAFVLARKFSAQGGPVSGWRKLDNISGASLEELQNVPDIGPIVAQSIYDWFQKTYNRKLINKFKKIGIHIIEEKMTKESTKFVGKSFVVTGSLESLTREQAQDRIRELGGDVSSSVSKETDYVVAGSSPGSKYDKAKKLGIKIIDEKEFLKMI